MPISKEEFEKRIKTRLSEQPTILKFLYDNRDKVYTLDELFLEADLLDMVGGQDVNDFVSLVRMGYIDIGVDKTQVNSEDYTPYIKCTISKKGIEELIKIYPNIKNW